MAWVNIFGNPVDPITFVVSSFCVCGVMLAIYEFMLWCGIGCRQYDAELDGELSTEAQEFLEDDGLYLDENNNVTLIPTGIKLGPNRYD